MPTKSSQEEATTSEQRKKASNTRMKKVNAELILIEDLTPTIKLVSFRVVPGSTVEFQAGQFVGVYDGRRQDSNNRDEKHEAVFPGTYSIASPPSDLPVIRFAIGTDHNPRSLRHCLYHHAKIHDTFRIDAVGSGTVSITPQMLSTPMGGPGGIMLIGGGSAVMGLVAIVEELLHNPAGTKIPAIKLLHSNRSNHDIPFYDRMKELETKHANFCYKSFVTGSLLLTDNNEVARGQTGRITVHDLADQLAGVRLFCVCGSGVFCESIVNMLIGLGVWPGSIRTDYTTRVDPARKLRQQLVKWADSEDDSSAEVPNGAMSDVSSEDGMDDEPVNNRPSTPSTQSTRFASIADGTQDKGSMDPTGDSYIKTYGIDVLLGKLTTHLVQARPDYPLQFMTEFLTAQQAELPEIMNVNAADPEFWINYWETDKVTWQAPVVSPWLERHLEKLVGIEEGPKVVFVPLCGKSLDMKYLLDAGHTVIGADCSGIACTDFFSENNIPGYVRETIAIPSGQDNDDDDAIIVRHRSTVVPLTLYEGDIFRLTREIIGGPVDCILDRAALVALPPSMIENQYLLLLASLLKRPGGKILLASVNELPFPKAPPHIYQPEQIEPLLSKYFSNIELLETHRYRVNAGYVSEPIYIMTHTTESVEL
jgi:thiopurine S-methyltransferase